MSELVKLRVSGKTERFKNSGRFKAFSFDRKEGDTLKPHIFWDSDVPKRMEEADNGENLSSILVNRNLNYEIAFDKELDDNTIITDGFRFKEQDELYADFDNELIKTGIKFIPYRLFANRGESEMTVWCNLIKKNTDVFKHRYFLL